MTRKPVAPLSLPALVFFSVGLDGNDEYDLEEEEEYADGGEVKNYKDFEDFSMGVSHKKNEVVLIDGKRYVVSKVTGGSYGDRVDLLGIDAENRNDGIRLLIDTSGGVLKQEKFASGGYMAKGGVVEHGLRKGDKIVSEMYNIAGVINEDSGEAALVDIETGKREEIK